MVGSPVPFVLGQLSSGRAPTVPVAATLDTTVPSLTIQYSRSLDPAGPGDPTDLIAFDLGSAKWNGDAVISVVADTLVLDAVKPAVPAGVPGTTAYLFNVAPFLDIDGFQIPNYTLFPCTVI